MKENYLQNKEQKKNNQQPKTKHQTPSGITLVALVITIIILLILAGVAISMITGGDGLFVKANNAATKYNESAENEAELIEDLSKSEFFLPKTNGSFSEALGMNTPDTSNLPTTKYVTWTNNNGTYDIVENDTQPENWYDYGNGKWANIKTTSTDETLEAYWVWIPRFAYKMPTTGTTPSRLDVVFLKGDTNIGVLDDGTEVTCYQATDEIITAGGTGLWTNATDAAKGTNGATQEYIIHPAFTFWDTQLAGFWFAKFEASSETPTATNGGGNVTTLKVQIKPGVTSWRYIQTANAWEVCRAIQETDGALGTEIARSSTKIDTHMAKNMEWGAVAALSQSKYGVFNPKSATGLTENGGDNTLRVWNNPNSSYITGTVGSGADAASIADASCTSYNTGNGPKGSSTGTVYGVYDIAGGAWEQVMGIMETSAGSNTPSNSNTGFNSSNPWPEAKYYDIYAYGTSATDYSRGEIGDLTRELNPAPGVSWNGDDADFANNSNPFFYRGGFFKDGTIAGVFAFNDSSGGAYTDVSFRPVFVSL